MQDAMVEAAAYVMGGAANDAHRATLFVRLLKEIDRPGSLRSTLERVRSARPSRLVRRVAISEFEAVPGAPFVYSAPSELLALFRSLPALEGSGAEVRQGLATSSDFEFVRAFWEVPASEVSSAGEAGPIAPRWVPFAKGGEYSPFYSDLHLLVDWSHDGRRIRERVAEKYPYLEGNTGWVVKNTQFYFRPAVSWPSRTNSAFAPRHAHRGASSATWQSQHSLSRALSGCCLRG